MSGVKSSGGARATSDDRGRGHVDNDSAISAGEVMEVSADKIALIEISPSREQKRLAVAVTIALFAAALVIIPNGSTPFARIDAFVPMADAILLVLDLVAATLLMAQASVIQSRALIALGSSYVFTAVMIVAHALTFPGAFSPRGLLGGGLNTTVWIVFFWTAGLPLGVLAYAILRRMDATAPTGLRSPSQAISLAICASGALAIALCAFASLAQGLLPSLMRNRLQWNLGPVLVAYGLIAMLLAAAMLMVWRLKRSLLDIWLLVALVALLAQMVVDVAAEGRFTLAWYFSRLMGLLEHLLVVLVLLAETSRMYTRSALSLIALKRERESRMTSMYAVASAMAHEVRQPLTGMALHARAAIERLGKPRPNREAIAKTLIAIVEDSHRASDVVVSIRDVLAHETGDRTEFDLNDLVRETVSRMERQLAAQNISVTLALTEPLPLIRANRVQMQEVLVNLITNSIDSLRHIRRRHRRNITIRSSSSGYEKVLLEVTDSGPGPKADQITRMFEPFFTTKEKGTGLGLALCRSIVEAHEGLLWATTEKDAGIAFHLQLPNSMTVQ